MFGRDDGVCVCGGGALPVNGCPGTVISNFDDFAKKISKELISNNKQLQTCDAHGETN